MIKNIKLHRSYSRSDFVSILLLTSTQKQETVISRCLGMNDYITDRWIPPGTRDTSDRTIKMTKNSICSYSKTTIITIENSGTYDSQKIFEEMMIGPRISIKQMRFISINTLDIYLEASNQLTALPDYNLVTPKGSQLTAVLNQAFKFERNNDDYSTLNTTTRVITKVLYVTSDCNNDYQFKTSFKFSNSGSDLSSFLIKVKCNNNPGDVRTRIEIYKVNHEKTFTFNNDINCEFKLVIRHRLTPLTLNLPNSNLLYSLMIFAVKSSLESGGGDIVDNNNVYYHSEMFENQILGSSNNLIESRLSDLSSSLPQNEVPAYLY